MLRSMTLTQARAAMRLEQDQDWGAIREFLMEQLENIDERLRYAEGIDMHRNQGAAQVIDELLAQMRDARAVVKASSG